MSPQDVQRNRGGRPPRLALDDIVTVSESIVTHEGVEAHTAELDRSPFFLGMVADVDQDTMPHLAELANEWTTARKTDAYAVGLGALIDGFVGTAG